MKKIFQKNTFVLFAFPLIIKSEINKTSLKNIICIIIGNCFDKNNFIMMKWDYFLLNHVV